MPAQYPAILAALALACCLTACTSSRTNPIQDAQGRTIPGSIASLEQITLGGVPQWILLRGHNAANPILLKLHGGPGQAEMATIAFNRRLERDFVVVEWDQRGSGKSARSSEPESGMNVAQFVEDTHQLTRFLLQRFHQHKLILVGHSWGSVIGLKAVQKYPDSYAAFVSTGQIANLREGMRLGYRFLLDEASRRNDADALKVLSEMGAPPYFGEGSSARRDAYAKLLTEFGGFWHSDAKFEPVLWMISSVEYAWPEKLRYSSAARRSFDLLLPQLAEIDMTRDVPSVEIPVYFALGRYDRTAPPEVAQAYFGRLSAPRKELVWFEHSAHFPHWEEAEKFHELLLGLLPAMRAAAPQVE